MKCPACNEELFEIQAGKVKVDACTSGCAGIWFDWDEIKHFDEPHEMDATPLLTLKRTPNVTRNQPPLQCPRCDGEVLGRQYFDPKNEVEIDLCWSCSGIWLDPGELQNIRAQFKTIEERQKAGDEFVNSIMREHRQALDTATKEQVQKLEEKNENILKALFNSFRQLLDPMDDGLFK